MAERFGFVGRDRGFFFDGVGGLDLFEYDAGMGLDGDERDSLAVETLVLLSDGRTALHRAGTMYDGCPAVVFVDGPTIIGWLASRNR
jgi:hypothetical protein